MLFSNKCERFIRVVSEFNQDALPKCEWCRHHARKVGKDKCWCDLRNEIVVAVGCRKFQSVNSGREAK